MNPEKTAELARGIANVTSRLATRAETGKLPADIIANWRKLAGIYAERYLKLSGAK